MWSTYPVATTKGMATAFVIVRKGGGKSGASAPVMVTAGHLLDSVGKGPLVIAVRVPGKDGGSQLAVIGLPKQHPGKLVFARHPGEDVGAFDPSVLDNASRQVLPSFLTESSLVRDARSLHAGEEVSFLGFPDLVPGTSGGFPVVRSGKIASYPAAQPHSGGTFLINADVYPGDSGAPVFISRPGGKPELVGMVIERVGKSAGAFSHFAIAVDAKAIRETLALLAEREKSAAKP